jgi:hypothetical protein
LLLAFILAFSSPIVAVVGVVAAAAVVAVTWINKQAMHCLMHRRRLGWLASRAESIHLLYHWRKTLCPAAAVAVVVAVTAQAA